MGFKAGLYEVLLDSEPINHKKYNMLKLTKENIKHPLSLSKRCTAKSITIYHSMRE